MKAIIVGGGVGGLTAALMLHARGIDCEIFEQSDQVRELGVGINTLPHAIKELAQLGLLDRLDSVAIRTYELFYCNRFGQEIWREPRGTDAGFDFPQFSIHRGRLQGVIYQAVRARLGESQIHTGARLGSFTQDETGVTAYFFDRDGSHVKTARGDVLIGADGIHSFVRAQLFPNEEPPRFTGTVLWRGALDWPKFLTGRSMVIAGGMGSKLVLYPIAEGTREDRCLMNWALMIKVGQGGGTPKQGRLVAPWPLRRHDAAFEAHLGAALRRSRADRGHAGILGISALRPRSIAVLDERAGDTSGRRRASDVSGRIEWRLAGHSRRALSRRSADATPIIRATRSTTISRSACR